MDVFKRRGGERLAESGTVRQVGFFGSFMKDMRFRLLDLA